MIENLEEDFVGEYLDGHFSVNAASFGIEWRRAFTLLTERDGNLSIRFSSCFGKDTMYDRLDRDDDDTWGEWSWDSCGGSIRGRS